jgi:hypothetical protein
MYINVSDSVDFHLKSTFTDNTGVQLKVSFDNVDVHITSRVDTNMH